MPSPSPFSYSSGGWPGFEENHHHNDENGEPGGQPVAGLVGAGQVPEPAEGRRPGHDTQALADRDNAEGKAQPFRTDDIGR